MNVTVQEHNLTCLLDLSSFLKAPSSGKHCNLQPCLVALPGLSSEGCFIFPLEFSMPCFPLHIKGQKSRWWTRSLSSRVRCQVCLSLSPPTNSSLPGWSSLGEFKTVCVFPSWSPLSVNYLGSTRNKKTDSENHTKVCLKPGWFLYKISMLHWTERTNRSLYLTAAGDFMLNRFFNIVWPSTVKRKTTFSSWLLRWTWFLQINNLQCSFYY